MSTPSRHSNPFATCWTRPDAVRYLPQRLTSPEQLVSQLAKQQWRGQIVGPHGVGKSTLLCALQQPVTNAGKDWLRVDLRDRGGSAAWPNLRTVALHPQTVLVVDGFEQLSLLRRWRLRWRCQQAGAGLLVTCHAPIGLPTLVNLAPSLSLTLEVFHLLTEGSPSLVTKQQVQNSYKRCHGNLREILLDLYDLHERHLRQGKEVALLEKSHAAGPPYVG